MMVNRLSIHLLIQLGVVLLVGTMAGFVAIILTGAIGGVAMGVAPEFTFSLVEGVVCPEGTSLKYYAVKRSYHDPGESEPHLECVGEDGMVKEVLLEAILAVLGLVFAGVFLAVFVPVFIPLAVIGVMLSRKAISTRRE